MDALMEFLYPGIGLLATIVFGFWLSWQGKPYNGALFNVHKLLALGTVIFIVIKLYGLLMNMQVQPIFILSMAVAIIGVIALFASGAFLSIGSHNYGIMKLVHNIAVFLLAIGLGLVVYFLIGITALT